MTAAPTLDPRLHAYDPERRLAEASLEGQVEGEDWRWLTAKAGWAGNARLSLRAAPDEGAEQVSEALPGEAVSVLWREAGWAWVKTGHDRYPGWVRAAGVLNGFPTGETLTVTALRAHAYARPKVSAPLVAELCFGAVVVQDSGESVTEGGRVWRPVLLPDGAAAWVQAVCFLPVAGGDVADFALRFLEVPYVWGGRSAWGLDCSGLSQLAYAAFGRAMARDADLQQVELTAVAEPIRGDLAFFPGHVGIMLDERRMVHANATHMRVTVETFGEGDYGTRLAASCKGFGRWTV
ncbi:NlpC/P60 family protein [Deinococcus sp. QL22]|uniref:C40 family peptidase n=1 Tax=Deinococcus sp. QL22 TaxID=2939437 RepID=UPI0020181576|nr:NlpC/P60 family protein [Deinococcus sp. QL22]UQN06054.1 C40 family peptidase [Deinococcus sp. QL22]